MGPVVGELGEILSERPVYFGSRCGGGGGEAEEMGNVSAVSSPWLRKHLGRNISGVNYTHRRVTR